MSDLTLEEKKVRYLELCHAMQTGVGFKMEKDPTDTTPKHLRVGLNSVMVQHGALASLLIQKGIITEDEYYDSLIETMEREIAMYEATLKKLYNAQQGQIISLR